MPTKDPFRIDLVVRHCLFTPEQMAQALSLKPRFGMGKGPSGRKARKRNYAYFRLQSGDYAFELEGALRKTVKFLDKHSAFWAEILSQSAEVELVLGHTLGWQWEENDKTFELRLAPAFLNTLAGHKIALRIETWQGKARPGSRAKARAR